jgi:hypothetical protein
MQKRTRSLAVLATCATFLLATLITTSASADDTARSGRASVEPVDQGYAYAFDDDPLAAASNGSYTAQIRVVPGGVRRTLIRPRLHFIPELLKSVEKL